MHDPSLHLFVDDQHIRTLFGLRREFGKLEKRPEPALEDIPGRLACWACVLREPDGRYRMWYQSVAQASAHDLARAGVWGRGEEFGYFPDQPIPGYEPENCLPIAEDAVRAPVRWRDRATVAELKGRNVQVFVRMNAGRLYAVRV